MDQGGGGGAHYLMPLGCKNPCNDLTINFDILNIITFCKILD